jgi:hypothetical protein
MRQKPIDWIPRVTPTHGGPASRAMQVDDC